MNTQHHANQQIEDLKARLDEVLEANNSHEGSSETASLKQRCEDLQNRLDEEINSYGAYKLSI